jgi:hypothetical protein
VLGIRQIRVESGDELTRRLALLNFEIQRDLAYHVFGVEVQAPAELSPAYDHSSAARFRIKAVDVVIGDQGLDLDRVRAAVAASINEVPLTDNMGAVQGFDGSGSVRRLVSLRGNNYVRVADPALSELNDHLQSRTQPDYLPLELALKPLLDAVPAEHWNASPVELHRGLLVARMTDEFRAAPTWVREFFLVLASRLGSAPLIPGLIQVAREGTPNESTLALGALAAITGRDERFDSNGKPRSMTEVAADYERECAR